MIAKKVFFSYARSDGSSFAQRLAHDLESREFDVWIDKEDIRAGAEWDMVIQEGLDKCDCLLFIETEKSVTSNNVLNEVYYVLEQGKKVIPLIVRDSKTPSRLQRLQHIDFTGNYHEGLTHLLNELNDVTDPNLFDAVQSPNPGSRMKSLFSKHAKLVVSSSAIIILFAAVFIFFFKDGRQEQTLQKQVVPSTKSALDREVVDANSPEALPKEALKSDRIIEFPSDQTSLNKKQRTSSANAGSNILPARPSASSCLPEMVTGEWILTGIQPAAKSQSGYLKIESSNDKLTVKSAIQFYYNKSNDTSYLSIFNAFAGCESCILSKEMKLKAEDIAIGSQTYKVLKEGAAGGNAGDTVLNAGSNKSIRGMATLHFIDARHASLKVSRATRAELSYGLILPPFEYTFQFVKSE